MMEKRANEQWIYYIVVSKCPSISGAYEFVDADGKVFSACEFNLLNSKEETTIIIV
jgi:hypothetical protein